MNWQAGLLPALRNYWGYESFRPLQGKIIQSLLTALDTCVVMPTGGGKSLCYQLPAVMLSTQTVVVISPLIALMQDQVAQLTQMGIPATLLNSSQTPQEQAAVLRKAPGGAYRLLYLSPERLANVDTIRWLQRLPISFFVIDEAHCISEWGHEFRPEYRQLSSLRTHFPDKPIAAFTASATRQVRHDIIEQLKLRDAEKYIASFYRSNLQYVVKECAANEQRTLLVRALRKYAGSNVIVYAPTITKVEETVQFLEEQGIEAVAYHGKMDAPDRRRNQELWMSDDIRVLVGTIAFGLGINKAAVRAVIHLSLPKSIEQYYQEAGRAGRDGKSADCLLLWRKRDIGLLTYFIQSLSDPVERQRAWARYHTIRRFAETKTCRHRQICGHFGENPKWTTCAACDVCNGELEWLSTPISVGQPKRKRGAKPIRQAGPGDRQIFAGVARYLSPAESTGADTVSGGNFELREYLREWRRNTAKERGMPAFVVMHDTSLDELSRMQPRSLAEIRRIYGFGERKVELYGKQILEALKKFRDGARAAVT